MKKIFFIFLMSLLISNFSFAETSCMRDKCDITITLKIAFSGADDEYITRAEQEIETTWNGPNGFRTVGDCGCSLEFEVITGKIDDCKNNPPADWHCIMVTDYNRDPPRNQTNWTGAEFYIGYMYNVSSGNGGNSEKGWWSNIMSRPVDENDPNGEHYKDFAHEAGHMMGLEDGDGGIMSNTNGPDSSPTKENIEEIIEDICGEECPEYCCCGNGKIDKGIGEECDPFAEPSGCMVRESCCPVCCNCFAPVCIPANGEYYSQKDCNKACHPASSCYKNHRTGCWDCIKQEVIEHDECRDMSSIRGRFGCEHIEVSFIDLFGDFYNRDISKIPLAGSSFGNERVNIFIGEETGNLILQNGHVISHGTTLLEDPTVTITTDYETMADIMGEKISAEQAIAEERILIEGNGFFNTIRFWAYDLLFDIYNVFAQTEENALSDVAS